MFELRIILFFSYGDTIQWRKDKLSYSNNNIHTLMTKANTIHNCSLKEKGRNLPIY